MAGYGDLYLTPILKRYQNITAYAAIPGDGPFGHPMRAVDLAAHVRRHLGNNAAEGTGQELGPFFGGDVNIVSICPDMQNCARIKLPPANFKHLFG